MIAYKVLKDPFSGQVRSVQNIEQPLTSIPCDPANMDYQRFKDQINADEAKLEGDNGVLMTPEEARAYIAELP